MKNLQTSKDTLHRIKDMLLLIWKHISNGKEQMKNQMNYTDLNRVTSKIQQSRQSSGADLYFGRYVQVLKTYFDTRYLYARSFPRWTVQTTIINQNNNLVTFLHIFLLKRNNDKTLQISLDY